MAQPLQSGTVADRVQNNRLRSLIRYWTEKRQNRPMPARSEIDPIEIPRLLPIVLMANWAPAGASIRLLGTEATNGFGREIRGRLVDNVDFGEFTSAWTGAFRDSARDIAPSVAAGRFHNGIEQCAVELVLMPLSDDGTNVSHIFGGLAIRPFARNGVVASDGVVASYISAGVRQRDFMRQTLTAI